MMEPGSFLREIFGDDLPDGAVLVADIAPPRPPPVQMGFAPSVSHRRSPLAELPPVWIEVQDERIASFDLQVERHADADVLRVQPTVPLALDWERGIVERDGNAYLLEGSARIRLVGADGRGRCIAFREGRIVFAGDLPSDVVPATSIVVPEPDVDELLGPGPWAAWLRDDAVRLARSDAAFTHIASVGLIGRLWSYARSSLEQGSPIERCALWIQRLDGAQLALARRATHSAVALLREELETLSVEETPDETRMRLAAELRDDIQSAAVALSYVGPVADVVAATHEADAFAIERGSHWAEMVTEAGERWEAVASDEPDAWWAGAEELG
jgi:hypothetical protein